jgi:hypothetical protein
VRRPYPSSFHPFLVFAHRNGIRNPASTARCKDAHQPPPQLVASHRLLKTVCAFCPAIIYETLTSSHRCLFLYPPSIRLFPPKNDSAGKSVGVCMVEYCSPAAAQFCLCSGFRGANRLVACPLLAQLILTPQPGSSSSPVSLNRSSFHPL